MRKTSEPWLSAGLVALVTLLTYGILIPWLGFYRDDWYLLSTWQSHGAPGVIALFQIDRPLRGYVYVLELQLLGTWPLAWQLATLFLRLAGNLAFLWLLRLLWPERRKETLAAALLYSIYPGYLQLPNAALIISDAMTNAAAISSMALSVLALRTGRLVLKVAFSVLAGALALLYFGLFESAVGLEAARFAVLFYVLWLQARTPFVRVLLRTLRADALYIILTAGFLVWRLFIFQSTRRATDVGSLVGKYVGSPLYALAAAGIETMKDVLETAFFAWVVPFYQFVARGSYQDLLKAVVLAAILVSCMAFGMRRVPLGPKNGEAAQPAEFSLHWILLGAWIVVLALLPINLAGRDVLFSDQWDRYTIYPSIGVAILLAGLIFRYLPGRGQTVMLLALLGLSVVTHFFSAARYRDFWAQERGMWQQLAWRAPGLKPGTLLMAVVPGMGVEEGYELYGPANMIYYPGKGVVLGGDVVNADTVSQLQLQKNRSHYDRGVLVADNYQDALIMAYPTSQSCLHVLDGRKLELPGLLDDSLLVDAAIYSRIDQIEAEAAAAPASLPAFLGGEEPRAWCNYYQRMDLARQLGDWQQVAVLADEASTRRLKPEDVSELMPALEAYATLGRVQDARHAASIIRANEGARVFLCLQLQRGAAYPAPYAYNQVVQVLCPGGGQ